MEQHATNDATNMEANAKARVPILNEKSAPFEEELDCWSPNFCAQNIYQVG